MTRGMSRRSSRAGAVPRLAGTKPHASLQLRGSWASPERLARGGHPLGTTLLSTSMASMRTARSAEDMLKGGTVADLMATAGGGHMSSMH
jgi:hypothetical protein